MPASRIFRILFACVLAGLAVCACSRKPTSTADIPRQLPRAYKISVAPFTQPLHPGQLIAGQIPEYQGKVPRDALIKLDAQLRDVLLSDTKRTYNFIPRKNSLKGWDTVHSKGQPAALKNWLAYGRENGAEFLLVPQVLDWHEREGSEGGVTDSAHVRVEFYLININDALVGGRSIYEEKQVGLTENLLTVGEFFKRKGRWISATELSVEGMRKAVKDLGL